MEKLLVPSNFSFSHSVFKRFVGLLLRRKNKGGWQNGCPCPKQQILDSSKMKESADDNIKFVENGRKLARRVENTVGKGEIARYDLYCRHVKTRACLGKG